MFGEDLCGIDNNRKGQIARCGLYVRICILNLWGIVVDRGWVEKLKTAGKTGTSGKSMLEIGGSLTLFDNCSCPSSTLRIDTPFHVSVEVEVMEYYGAGTNLFSSDSEKEDLRDKVTPLDKQNFPGQ